MATYAISDLHGALDEFQSLLKKIDFKYDGSDSLYLLGDYGDWGAKSLETIRFVRELDRQYPFVHVLMGNHELMFLTTILSGYREGTEDINAENWLFTNHGLQTWKDFLQLEEEEKKDLALWLHGLRLSATVKVGEKTYMLAHAYPYFYDRIESEEEGLQRRVDALWRRLMLREDPFAEYGGEEHYDMFVCGHTITDYYFGRLRLERNWPYRKPGEYVRNRIFRGEKFIDIDCGAKCMDMIADSHEFIQMAALRAQLACLRLDDEKGFYARRLHVRLPEVSFPMRIPEVSLPDLPNIQSIPSRLNLRTVPYLEELYRLANYPGHRDMSVEELQNFFIEAGVQLFKSGDS